MPSSRKRNRLQNWDYASEGLYFITICTVQKQCLLGRIVGDDAHIVPYRKNDADMNPRICLSENGKIVDQHLQFMPGIMQYCIMPNHIHALILVSTESAGPMWASAPTQSIPQRIRSFKTLVTKVCGTTLFQRSYYDHIVRDEKDYLRISDYINNNPAKWAEDVYYS